MIRLSSQHHGKVTSGFWLYVGGVMSRRRDPAPVKKSGPLSGMTTGSLYGESIGVKPGAFLGLPMLNPANLQKPKLSVPTGVQVNQNTKSFDVELMQSDPGKDPTALSLRMPTGYTDLSGRALIRISVWRMRNPAERAKVLRYVVDAVVPKLPAQIRSAYEDEPIDIVQNQNCGSGWSSSAHFFLVGKKDMDPPAVDFDNACENIFGVMEGTKFTFDGDEWMWSTDTKLVPTDQHQKLKITLVEPEAMAVDAVDGP
tara:strand:+ start:11844 stop:12611 length:768 start_codon:yes stop_codon:yes gene_type:complete